MIQEEENKKSTKDTFLIEALRLFAQKGYEAVSVGQIAKAVNVSAPALYKHYAGKQELFESIIEASNEGYERHMRMLKLDFENNLEMRPADVRILSIQYLAPIYTLISVCDREPKKEQWALDTIADYVKEFNRNYRIEW